MRPPAAASICALLSSTTARALSHGGDEAWRPPSSSSPSYADVLRLADTVRSQIALPPPPLTDPDALRFPSAYPRPDGLGMRGYCNWIITGKLMVGQYPGTTPEAWGPTAEQAEEHVRLVVIDGGVRVFCSLQSEVPAQDDDGAWGGSGGGEVYLPHPSRERFPRPFSRYAPAAVRAARSRGGEEVTFLRAPILDLSVPDSAPLLSLLSDLLRELGEGRGAIYLHCWGGRGRAGLVGACLASLLWPEMDGGMVLDLVQAGYDSRLGSEAMPEALSWSPQTEEQRRFVVRFVEERRRRSF